MKPIKENTSATNLLPHQEKEKITGVFLAALAALVALVAQNNLSS